MAKEEEEKGQAKDGKNVNTACSAAEYYPVRQCGMNDDCHLKKEMSLPCLRRTGLVGRWSLLPPPLLLPPEML